MGSLLTASGASYRAALHRADKQLAQVRPRCGEDATRSSRCCEATELMHGDGHLLERNPGHAHVVVTAHALSPGLTVPLKILPKASNELTSGLGNSLAMWISSGPLELQLIAWAMISSSWGPVYSRLTCSRAHKTGQGSQLLHIERHCTHTKHSHQLQDKD